MNFAERPALVAGILILLSGGTALQPLVRETKGGGDVGRVGGRCVRALAADWFWLETDLAWERRDAGQTRYFLGLTLAAEPEPLYFWLNGARMLAYDLPAWNGDRAPVVAAAVQAQRRKAAAWEALRFLQNGLRWHPDSAALHVEMGNICLYALGDTAGASEHYRMAAAQPDAPTYAGRIYRRLHNGRH